MDRQLHFSLERDSAIRKFQRQRFLMHGFQKA